MTTAKRAAERANAAAGARECWALTGEVDAAAGQRAELAALLAEMRAVAARIEARAARRMARWAGFVQRAEFAGSAANLADWLAFRAEDLAALQPRLAALGLSSLGRLDGHVRPSIQAVIAALVALSGEGRAEFPAAGAIAGDAAVLAARRDALFGPREGGPETRIMVTLPGIAATEPALVRDMVKAGADCFRINCAHDDAAAWAAMIGHVRAAGAAAGRYLPVSMDLGGPKFRIARLHGNEKHRLVTGDGFYILAEGARAPHGALAVRLSHPELAAALAEGREVVIDDGKITARVQKIEAGCAEMRVLQAPLKGARLKLEKGVNLPGARLEVPALTQEDLEALDFVMREADVVSYSFVQSVADIEALLAAMATRVGPRGMPALILKIETPRALEALPDLVVAAGGRMPVGVMIARGDLAVEIGFDRLSEIQEEVLWLCAAAQVPVVWATQVLETMVKEGQATRAEVTDAAMGQRAEAVMLNKGPHAARAVAFLRDVLGRMDRHQAKKSARLGPLHLWREA
jgi:pyruvate kinase